MKYIFLSILTVFVFTGCSTKEISEGVDGIVNDVNKAFSDSKDD